MELSATDQAKCKFHLGYNFNTPAIDLARLYRAMKEVPDIWTLGRLSGLIQRCEDAYSNSVYNADTLYNTSLRTTTSESSSSTLSQDALTSNEKIRHYYNEIEFLATSLGVRNYRNPEQAINAYLMDGGTYIKSIPGADGTGGSIWFNKSGIPEIDEFEEKLYDLCIDVNTSDLYQRGENSWTLINNIKGLAGEPGNPGNDGDNGVKWYSKNGIPTNNEFTENIGDFCLDTSNGNAYEKTDATTWTLAIGLKGEPGAGITWRGEWNSGINYNQYDAVEYNKNSYIADIPSINKPPDISIEWDLWVSQGDKGDTGTVTASSGLTLTQITTPSEPSTGNTIFYSKSDGKLYYYPNGGAETEVGSGSSGGASLTDIWLYGGF